MIPGPLQLTPLSLIGLAATSSVLPGAAIGLYFPFFKRALAWFLAFAAGALISAFSIKLAHQAAQGAGDTDLGASSGLAIVAVGFALGAIIHTWASRLLDRKGAVVGYPARFRKYALQLKQLETKELIELLPKCDLLRHLPPEKVGDILPHVQRSYLKPQEILFRTGDPADALYIVARGKVEVLKDSPESPQAGAHAIAELGEGNVFGEMALLSGGPRTATIRAVEATDLLRFDKKDFERMVASDRQFAKVVHRISHERATYNLRTGGPDLSTWTNIAGSNLSFLSRSEENKMLAHAGHGAGWAIVLGNMLDFVPACLLVGSNFAGLPVVSYTLMLGIFLGGIPIAATSAEMLKRAGYGPLKIYGIWSTVLIAGVLAVIAGKLFGGSGSLPAIFVESVAGSAVLALVAREMIPESLHQGGSSIVLPLIAGFFLAPLAASFV